MYLSLQCHHQNDSCIKMGSDESHFNVSLIVRDKVTETVFISTNFEERGKPKRNRALLLTSLTPYRWAKPVHKTIVSRVKGDIVTACRYCHIFQITLGQISENQTP